MVSGYMPLTSCHKKWEGEKMRQVFFQKPWIYKEEPLLLRKVYYKYGTLEKLKRGTVLINGGPEGKFYYLKKGLVAFSFQDKNGKSFIFSLVLPGRALADIDGLTRELVNVTDMVIRPSEVLSIDFNIWQKHIGNNLELMHLFAKGLIAKEESHMEAMLSNYTLNVTDRLKVFLKVLITSCKPEIENGWNQMPLYLSYEEYAQIVGASKVSVTRAMKTFQEEELIKKENRNIYVHSNLFQEMYDWTNHQ